MKNRILGLVLALCLLSGCGGKAPARLISCTVVLEESPAYTAQTHALTLPVGQAAQFALTPAPGWLLTGTDYPDSALRSDGSGGYQLTLPAVRYSCTVAVTAEKAAASLTYCPNGGTPDREVTLYSAGKHRPNTDPGTLFTRPGYTLTGWNTAPDGSGTPIGLGSRADAGAVLYAQWAEWAAEADFTYTIEGGSAHITGYSGTASCLVVPARLGNCPVVSIEENAFADTVCDRVILPPTLRQIAVNGFARSAVRELTLFDSVQSLSDFSFADCDRLETLHLNAATAPVYSGNYFSVFADKFDWLSSLQGQKKLVLFSGSSTRFGYDSPLLAELLPEYRPANMGVFAYTNALPQLELIRTRMEPGDVLLLSPELDAAKRQFCTTDKLDAPFYCMMEANYDLISLLNLREFSAVFSALNEYLVTRSGLTGKNYDLSPADFDEDGAPSPVKVYNPYGDYCLFRPEGADDTPIYGLPVEYRAAAYPEEQFLEPFNRECERFLSEGVRVCLTYSPRNGQAVSPESTPEEIAALDAYFRQGLDIPLLTPMESSLLPGRDFFGTDNHLTTAAAQRRTRQVAAALAQWLEQEEKET